MRLSKRLHVIASFVAPGSAVADIGTDHGYIPVYLVKEGIAPRALAMDVRKGPLERAKEHVREHGLSDRIALRLSDGLSGLKPGEADTVIIAGMGGKLVMRILEQGRHVWDSVKHFILSPQSDWGETRRFLEQAGFRIDGEAMVEEDGKFYVVMAVSRGEMRLSRACYYEYGKDLIGKKDPALFRCLDREKRTVGAILEGLSEAQTENMRKRQAALKERLAVIEEAQYEMQ
ncbi:SAM-dependent methyltransferase [Clostridiaceae bacterium]|nr:SAM-dependent methyltransferase [Clostridiaceae bacterium]